MKYYIDTEFHEYFRRPLFGQRRHVIDLISIGIVAEDGREYYAISKEFDIKAAWNSWQPRTGQGDRNNLEPRLYWLRENVLRQVFEELTFKEYMALTNPEAIEFIEIIKSAKNPLGFFKTEFLYRSINPYWKFTYHNFRDIIRRNGKTNGQIAAEIFAFVNPGQLGKKIHTLYGNDITLLNDALYQKSLDAHNIKYLNCIWVAQPSFYGYFSDYDWVVFCSLFGQMKDLPDGFPMYCRDIKHLLDHKAESMKMVDFQRLMFEKGNWVISGTIPAGINGQNEYQLEQKLDVLQQQLGYPGKSNEHNALADARWNKELHGFILSLP